MICGRTEEKLIAAVERVKAGAADGTTGAHMVADVTDEDSVQSAVATATELTGRLDGLFACAGGSTGVGPLATSDVEAIRCRGAYGAAKAGLDHLCRIAADEMGEFGVRVNSIQPGIVGTELMTPITGGGKLLDDYMPLIPLGRIGDPNDIAEMGRFLVGPESAWLTGQNIAVDGGQNLRRGADYGEMLREFGVDPMAPILGDTES